MASVLCNILRSIWSLFLSIVHPIRRLICRRRRTSEPGTDELVSVGTGDLRVEPPAFLPGKEEDEPVENWDSWSDGTGGPDANNTNGSAGKQYPTIHNYYYNQKIITPEPEPEPNFFEDMTPRVKKQPKILVRKKEAAQSAVSGSFTNRLGVMSDVPLANSELTAWEEESNAWDNGEASEDLTWQAEEAIREKRRSERQERQMEHQRKKQQREEARGIKAGLVATKLS